MYGRRVPWWVRLQHAFLQSISGIPRLFHAVAHGIGRAFFHLGMVLLYAFRVTLSWIFQRKVRYLLLGLPAVLGLLGLGTLGVFAAMDNRIDKASKFRKLATTASQDEDYDKALICYQRLALLNQERPEDQHGMAVTLGKLNQPDQAQAILETLAPADKQGYGPSHFQLARTILGKPEIKKEDADQAEKHLLRALQADEKNSQARALLGQFYLATNRPREAMEHLPKALDRPEARMPCLQMYLRMGKQAEAKRLAETMLGDARFFAKNNLDNHQARFFWADLAILLEQYDEAVAVLRDGLAIEDRPEYRQLLATMFLNQSESLAKQPGNTSAKRIDLLQKALEQDPSNPVLLNRLGELAKGKGPEAEKTREMLLELASSSKANSTVHFLLGTDAYQRGKTAEAKFHWDRALEMSPQMIMAMNNMAWLLFSEKPPQLDRALALIESALKLDPKNPRLLGTRGNIYRKMGKYKEALNDLQASLQVYDNSPDQHEALAEVYQKLGADEMAKSHLARAKKMGAGRDTSKN
ncbi:MAG: tetratricopeptide repeat protein [Gemmataceae bacterium]